MLTREQLLLRIESADFASAYGHVTSLASHLIEANGPAGTLGQLCAIDCGQSRLLAEVVAVNHTRLLLSPLASINGIGIGAKVSIASQGAVASVGGGFAGRAIDALGRPIDGQGPVACQTSWPIHGDLPSPLDREEPREPLETGIKALDGLLTLGRGQRMGIFAASGVGKTSLIEQIAAQAGVDRVILCLVGERGREVESLWRAIGEREDRTRYTIVAATSEESAPARARAPLQALALAEHWRAAGEHVLLIIDSVTRLAMALREIGLAAGAPPTVRAYTPNVFSALPRLVERCGAVRGSGAISAIMTVLSETDEVDDPIVEVMKSLLDGHIILSRGQADQGQFPAIDVIKSVSRGLEKRTAPGHRRLIGDVLLLLGSWNEARVLIETGAYRSGSNSILDRAIARRDAIRTFLRQERDQAISMQDAVRELGEAVGEARHG